MIDNKRVNILDPLNEWIFDLCEKKNRYFFMKSYGWQRICMELTIHSKDLAPRGSNSSVKMKEKHRRRINIIVDTVARERSFRLDSVLQCKSVECNLMLVGPPTIPIALFFFSRSFTFYSFVFSRLCPTGKTRLDFSF